MSAINASQPSSSTYGRLSLSEKLELSSHTGHPVSLGLLRSNLVRKSTSVLWGGLCRSEQGQPPYCHVVAR